MSALSPGEIIIPLGDQRASRQYSHTVAFPRANKRGATRQFAAPVGILLNLCGDQPTTATNSATPTVVKSFDWFPSFDIASVTPNSLAACFNLALTRSDNIHRKPFS